MACPELGRHRAIDCHHRRAGHFLFPSSPPTYMIDVREPGYLSARTPSEVWYGPSGTSPRFAITPEAVISGRLTSADGLPVAAAFLVVNRYTYADGEFQMIQGGSSGQTNERGASAYATCPPDATTCTSSAWAHCETTPVTPISSIPAQSSRARAERSRSRQAKNAAESNFVCPRTPARSLPGGSSGRPDRNQRSRC